MPFTLAHPAVLFPLLKQHKYVSATALIVGSMVPDVDFIAQMQESSTYSHQFPGVFLINFPLGILLCWLFHAVIKYFLIPNIPNGLHARFQFIMEFNWLSYAKKNKLIVLTSLGIGIASHLAWDAFTHSDGIFVSNWPSLSSPINFLNREMPIYHVLQIISSVIGLSALIYVTWRLPKVTIVHSVSVQYWFSFGLLVLLLSLMRFVLLDFNNGFWDVVLGVMGIGLYAVILNSFFHLIWHRKQAKPEP